jgi:predicted nucleotidyltransferase
VKASSELLREAVERLTRSLRPRRIVLFGSVARGTAREDSDYDLAVVAESDLP